MDPATDARQTDSPPHWGTELTAGLVTFLTMAYILVLNPAILGTVPATGDPTGLPFGPIMLATALAAALGSLAMGLYARLPIGLAPGMGMNLLLAGIIGVLIDRQVEHPWQVGLGIVFWAGVLFVVVSLLPIRKAFLQALSPSLRYAVTVGIGLFIAVVGLRNAGILRGPALELGFVSDLATPETLVFVVGFLVTAGCLVWRLAGGILWGIVAAALAAGMLGLLEAPSAVVSLTWDDSVAFQLDLLGALRWEFVPFIVMFLFVDLFDTTGTLVGVGQRAGLLDSQGQLPRAERAYQVDSAATVAGACLGTSPVTAYIESAAGVEHGGRTGLVAVTVGVLFAVAAVFAPVVQVVGSCLPATAAALVFVGVMMASSVRRIAWDDPTEAVPAFLVMLGIPLAFSIADGLALGLLSYPVLKLLAGRSRELSWMSYVVAAVLVAYVVVVRPQLP